MKDGEGISMEKVEGTLDENLEAKEDTLKGILMVVVEVKRMVDGLGER